MPQISVIVPVYKVEKFIHRCVDSILCQSFPDFEVILVDDGSPDRSGAICDAYAAQDPRVRVIHQENGGLSAARNAGIDWVFAHSDSQWLSFVDSDDYIHPEMLQVLYDAVVGNGVRISMCAYEETTGEPLEDARSEISLWSAADLFAKRNVNATVAWGKIYAKECFTNHRYPAGKIHEDEFLTYRILFAEKHIAVSDAKLYGYFQNMEGITKRAWHPGRMDVFEALDEQISFYQKAGYPDLAKSRLYCCLNNIRDQINLIRSCTEGTLRRSYSRTCRRKLRMMLRKYPEVERFGFIAHYPIYKDAYPLLIPVFWTVRSVRIHLGKLARRVLGNKFSDAVSGHLRGRK